MTGLRNAGMPVANWDGEAFKVVLRPGNTLSICDKVIAVTKKYKGDDVHVWRGLRTVYEIVSEMDTEVGGKVYQVNLTWDKNSV